MQYFLVYFWTCCCCPLGWAPFSFHGVKHLSIQAKRARITFQNIISIALFPCICLYLQLLPLGLGTILFHGTKHLSMQATQARIKLQNFISVARFPSLFVDFLLLPLGFGYPFHFMMQRTSQCKHYELE